MTDRERAVELEPVVVPLPVCVSSDWGICDHSKFGEPPCHVHEVSIDLWAHAGVDLVRHTPYQFLSEPTEAAVFINSGPDASQHTKSWKRDTYSAAAYKRNGIKVLLTFSYERFATWMHEPTSMLDPLKVAKYYDRMATLFDAYAIEAVNEGNYIPRSLGVTQSLFRLYREAWDVAKKRNPQLRVHFPGSDDVGWQVEMLRREREEGQQLGDEVQFHGYSWRDKRGYKIGFEDRVMQFVDAAEPFLNGRQMVCGEFGPRPAQPDLGFESEYRDETECAELTEESVAFLRARKIKPIFYRGRRHLDIMHDCGVLGAGNERGRLFEMLKRVNGVPADSLLGLDSHLGNPGDATVLVTLPDSPNPNYPFGEKRRISYQLTRDAWRVAEATDGAKYVELPMREAGVVPIQIRIDGRELRPAGLDVNGLCTGTWS